MTIVRPEAYKYYAYGFNILSDIPISAFEDAKFEVPDILIHEGEVPENLSNVVNRGVLFQSTEDAFLFTIEGIANFYVVNGREIIFKPQGNTSIGKISSFITSSIFSALLHQRHMLPLHASTVVYNEKVVMFAGVSGSGKSTLAAAMVYNGAILVSDDISVVSFKDLKPIIKPAYSSIKLWEDSLNKLNIDSKNLVRIREELNKFYLPTNQFNKKSKILDQIFILRSHNKPVFEINELHGLEKFKILRKNTHLFRGIPSTSLLENHFMLVNQLATCVPITVITRPIAEFNVTELIKMIFRQLNKGTNEST